MQVFADNPWFRSLPRTEADALLAAATPIRLAQGAALFRQGDMFNGSSAGAAFFGLASGLLKLSILHPDGSEAILTLIEPGNWFGEVSVLDRLPRAHSAIALSDSALLAVSVEKFNALMQRSTFAQAIATMLAIRLRLAYGLMGDSALQSTRERVGRRLALLAHGDITQSASGRDSVSTSQENLAMMLGISRPTLNKELQALARLGAISLRYGRIEILDMQLLQGEA